MKNFLNMLLTFGEYSGIGIKTSIGMGAYRLRVIERKPKTTQQAEG
jgi:CRISPR/Cas system endoribonuclease Cas6 (RAMP superfamily)